ncbi:MAG: magnesium transporter CorA family protein [Acidimicrobiales bacterium]
MKGTLTQNGQTTEATEADALAALAGKAFFWLDLDDQPGDGTVGELLGTHFGFHPLAVQSAETFSQRPRLDDYDNFAYLVARGADPDKTGKVEVHCFWTDTYVVTVHRGDCPALQSVRDRIGRHRASEAASPQIVIVYLVLDALVESFFPVLSAFDEKIDALEDDILKAPTEAQLGVLFDMKRSLMEMRKLVTPQRDMMAGITAGMTPVPGMTDAATRYFRDLYDHLIRMSDLVDSYRDLLTSVMDTHLSTVSNRLNVVMKQLAIIATVFLPLSFLTGFFGQNFSWMVGHLTGRVPFLVLGLGTELVAVVLLVILFKRRGWLGGPTV